VHSTKWVLCTHGYPKKQFFPSQRRSLPLGGVGEGLPSYKKYGFHKAVDRFVKALVTRFFFIDRDGNLIHNSKVGLRPAWVSIFLVRFIIWIHLGKG
jgi:hypothetical protein